MPLRIEPDLPFLEYIYTSLNHKENVQVNLKDDEDAWIKTLQIVYASLAWFKESPIINKPKKLFFMADSVDYLIRLFEEM